MKKAFVLGSPAAINKLEDVFNVVQVQDSFINEVPLASNQSSKLIFVERPIDFDGWTENLEELFHLRQAIASASELRFVLLLEYQDLEPISNLIDELTTIVGGANQRVMKSISLVIIKPKNKDEAEALESVNIHLDDLNMVFPNDVVEEILSDKSRIIFMNQESASEEPISQVFESKYCWKYDLEIPSKLEKNYIKKKVQKLMKKLQEEKNPIKTLKLIEKLGEMNGLRQPSLKQIEEIKDIVERSFPKDNKTKEIYQNLEDAINVWCSDFKRNLEEFILKKGDRKIIEQMTLECNSLQPTKRVDFNMDLDQMLSNMVNTLSRGKAESFLEAGEALFDLSSSLQIESPEKVTIARNVGNFRANLQKISKGLIDRLHHNQNLLRTISLLEKEKQMKDLILSVNSFLISKDLINSSKIDDNKFFENVAHDEEETLKLIASSLTLIISKNGQLNGLKVFEKMIDIESDKHQLIQNIISGYEAEIISSCEARIKQVADMYKYGALDIEKAFSILTPFKQEFEKCGLKDLNSKLEKVCEELNDIEEKREQQKRTEAQHEIRQEDESRKKLAEALAQLEKMKKENEELKKQMETKEEAEKLKALEEAKTIRDLTKRVAQSDQQITVMNEEIRTLKSTKKGFLSTICGALL